MLNIKSSLNPIDANYMKKEYGDKINENNLTKITGWKIGLIFKNEDKKVVDKYKRYILKKYIVNNYSDELSFSKTIKKLIKKLKIKLSTIEQQEIRLLDERVFSSMRHIKSLSTNVELSKGERIGVRFMNGEIFTVLNNGVLKLKEKGVLLFSNKRIIINNNEKFTSYYWNELLGYRFLDEGFQINYKKEKLLFRIHDQETLNNTIRNLHRQ